MVVKEDKIKMKFKRFPKKDGQKSGEPSAALAVAVGSKREAEPMEVGGEQSTKTEKRRKNTNSMVGLSEQPRKDQ
jgi:hypothetical protein